MKVAYGSLKRLQKSIEEGIITKETLIITSDEDSVAEIYFYDKDGKLKRAEKKTKFTSYSDASEWAKFWGSCGDIISIRDENGKWSPYFVDENLQIASLSSKLGGVSAIENKEAFPEIGSGDNIYIDAQSRSIYIWDGTNMEYVMVGCDYNDIILNGGNAYGKNR